MKSPKRKLNDLGDLEPHVCITNDPKMLRQLENMYPLENILARINIEKQRVAESKAKGDFLKLL